MSTLTFSLIIGALIVILLGARALVVMRTEKGAKRGSPPGTGYHEIDASYFSGGGGGGQQFSFRVPRDPDEYARRFVPRPSKPRRNALGRAKRPTKEPRHDR